MKYRIAIFSCLILLLGQMLWVPLDLPEEFYYLPDYIFKSVVMYIISREAKKNNFYYYLLLDYFFWLSITGIGVIFFDDPYKLKLYPYIIMVVFIIRMFALCAMHHTKLSFKSLLRKVFRCD